MPGAAQLDDEIQCKLYQRHLQHLGLLLDDPPEFYKLLRTLKDPHDESIRVYEGKDSMFMWLQRMNKQGKSCTEALISDYASKLAKIRHLLEGLREARLYEAANYVSEDILGIGPVSRLPGDEDSLALIQWIEALAREQHVIVPEPAPVDARVQPADLNPLGDRIIDPDETEYFTYDVLRLATGDFNRKPRSEGGTFIGDGGFGDVFYARLGSNRFEVAIKRLKQNRNITDTCIQKQVHSEFHELSKFKHPNVLRVLGASLQGNEVCIVYEFIGNGTLNQHLACKDDLGPLTAENRTKIAIGVARGIACLHTTMETPFVHRDIKSANVLLKNDVTPVIGDFGFARYGAGTGRNLAQTNMVTCFGYVPPEFGRSGDISVRKDIYCYGVILLELLTGKPPFDVNRKVPLSEDLGSDTGTESVHHVLDGKVNDWRRREAESLWTWAWRCLSDLPDDRPDMVQVLLEPVCGLENLLPSQ